MKKNQDTFLRNILVLALVAVYFLIATTHIFFIRCHTHDVNRSLAPTGNSIFKRKSEFMTAAGTHASYIQRTDKSTLEERKAFSDAIKSFLNFVTILLFIPLVWRNNRKIFTNSLNRLSQPYHSYLSLCVIRI